LNSDKYQSLIDVAGPVSRETFDGLEAFESMFLSWAERINLAAPSTLGDVWNRHILDSAQLAPLAPGAKRWLDLGSGGGFPGIVLAFLLKEQSGSFIELVESNRKKAGFLQAAIGQFSLPARVFSRRIGEEIKGLTVPSVITARALAPLPALLSFAFPWLSRGAIGLFHKGRDYQREVAESAHTWEFNLVEHRSKIDPDSVVLEITSLRRGQPIKQKR
jgi:16S rRNA (guanine527-N7)-methyltransferase